MVGDSGVQTVDVSPEKLAGKAAELRSWGKSGPLTLTTSRWWVMSTSGTALPWPMSEAWPMCWAPTAPLRNGGCQMRTPGPKIASILDTFQIPAPPVHLNASGNSVVVQPDLHCRTAVKFTITAITVKTDVSTPALHIRN